MKKLFFTTIFALAFVVVAKVYQGWVIMALVAVILFSFFMVLRNKSKKDSGSVVVFGIVGVLCDLILLVLGIIGSFLEYGAFTGIMSAVIVGTGLFFSAIDFLRVTEVDAPEKEKK